MSRFGWLVMVLVLFSVVGTILWLFGASYYLRAWRYVRTNPGSEELFRTEANKLAIGGIYVGVWKDKIWLWRDGLVRGYVVTNDLIITYMRGCHIEGYDESKLERIFVQDLGNLSALAQKGDFVVLNVDSTDIAAAKRIVALDYWPFVVDDRLEAQCNERK